VITKATIKLLRQEDMKAKKLARRKKLKALKAANRLASSTPQDEEESEEEDAEEDEGAADGTGDHLPGPSLQSSLPDGGEEEEERNPYGIQLDRLTRDVYGDGTEGCRGKYDLPLELVLEKERLLKEGFPDWTKAEYRLFLAALEKFGKNNLQAVVEEVQHCTEKDPKDIERYYKVFWKKYREVSDWQKIIDRIERGQKKIDRLLNLQHSINQKVKRHYGEIDLSSGSGHPADEFLQTSACSWSHSPSYQQLSTPWSLYYGNPGRGRYFVEEEDHALILLMHRYGYGSWDEIAAVIRHSKFFSFNWCFNSRTTADLIKRCDFLLRLIEKENEKENGPTSGVRITSTLGGGEGEGGEGENGSGEISDGDHGGDGNGNGNGGGEGAINAKGNKRKRKSSANADVDANAKQSEEANGERIPKKRGRKPGKKILPQSDGTSEY
jgi:hypothetical protein